MIRACLFALPLVLAGCSGSDAAQNRADAAAVANIEAASATNQVAPGVPKLTPIAAPAKPSEANAFPPAFQGRWGIETKDCDVARNDNNGVLVITGDALRFYDRRAKVTALHDQTRFKLTADLAFKGDKVDGKSPEWNKTEQFQLVAGDVQLVQSEPGKTLRYTRC